MGFFQMFFIALAFMVIGELLRPKPKIENAKPSALGDFQFPTADASRVIPIFCGKCKFKAPNTTYFGDLEIKPIKKKVKTGLFSSETIIQGYKYYLTVQLSWAWGYVDEFVRLEADDKIVILKNMVTTTDYFAFDMDDPSHMSDDDPKNGLTGHVVLYRGSTTQPTNAKLQSLWAEDQTQPFLMLSHMVLEHCYLGNSDTPPAFSLVMGRYPNQLGVTGGKHTYNDGDANPACWCYEILTNRIWGRKLDPALIDTASFIACAETLYDEKMGIAMQVDNAMAVRDLLAEVLRHVDGVIYPDPVTGLYTMALARADYDVDDLPELDDSDIPDEDFEFSRQSWEETKNLIIVNYTDREHNFAIRPAQYKDLGNINARFGQIDPETIDFLGYSNNLTARLAAERAGKTRAAPVVRTSFTGNRKAYDFRPATVFKMTKSRYGMNGLVMRVIDINYGTLDEPRIRITATEDVFHVNALAFEPTAPSDWVSPVGDIAPVAAQDLFEIPYHLIGAEERRIASVATPSSLSDIGYETWQDPAGGSSYVFGQRVPAFTPCGVLAADYPADTDAVDTVGFLLSNDYGLEDLSSINTDELYAGVNIALIVSAAGQEWIAWKTVATESGSYRISTVVRAVLDSIPLTHVAGARVWFVTDGVGQLRDTAYTSNSTVSAKLLPFNLSETLPIASAASITETITQRAWKPYPAANLQINGANDPVVSGDADVTWGIRHRVQQYNDTQVVAQDEASYVPTPEGSYTLKVYIGGVLKRTEPITVAPFDSYTYTVANRIADAPSDLVSNVEIGVTAVNGSYSSVERKSLPFYMESANAIVVTTTSAPSAVKDIAYSLTLTAANGIPGYTWSIQSGPLPAGLSLASNVISGTPTAVGSSVVTVRVTDSVGAYDDQVLTFNVLANAGDIYFGYVSSLFHFDGTNGSSTITDVCGKTWTATGGAALTTAQKKYGVSGLNLTTFGSYIYSAATQADYGFGSGDFTIEGYNYGSGGSDRCIFDNRSGSAEGIAIYLSTGAGGAHKLGAYSNTAALVFASAAFTDNTWQHWAVTREAGTLRLFLDGALVGSTTDSRTYASTAQAIIGANYIGSQSATAYADEIRITKGVARYTAAFTPPSASFSEFIGGFTSGQLAAHLHLDGANGSTVITDLSGKTWTAVGNAQISTAQSVFGGASLALDGTGDAISTPHSADFDFGTGDFTISLRARLAVTTGSQHTLCSTYGGTGAGWSLEIDTAGKVVFNCTGDGVDAQGVTVLAVNTWYDIVVARKGNKLRIFINGVLDVEVTDTSNITSTALCAIGALYNGSSYTTGVNGYEDEVLIVKGVALWDRTHTSPAAAFADV